jgi:hypothetical protein
MRIMAQAGCGTFVVLCSSLVAFAEQPSVTQSDRKHDFGCDISAAQIEADWLRQEKVRWLDPSPRSRAEAAKPLMTTHQDAAGGNDGVIDGTYGFHTSQDLRPWWQVDLGKVIPIAEVRIHNRCDGQVQARALRLQVLLSDDGETWSEQYQHDGTEFLGAVQGEPLKVRLDGKTARFVRVALPSQEYLHLDEIEVFGRDETENLALRQPADQSSVSPWSTADLSSVSDWSGDSKASEAGSLPEGEAAELNELPVATVIERGLTLSRDLAAQGVDIVQSRDELLHLQVRWAELGESASAQKRRDFYVKARRVVRRLVLMNPLLDFDDLLFVKRAPGTFTHMSDQYYGWWSRPGGGVYVLRNFKSDQPDLECLTTEFEPGSFLRPDVSYDGKRVLFAYCKFYPGLRSEPNKLDKANVPEDAFYHLFEMDLSSGHARRLTRGKYDDFDGRYLPDGRIVFLSTRRGQQVQYEHAEHRACIDGAEADCYVRCGGGPERPVAVYTLHVMDESGNGITPISPFEMFEWTPSVDHYGRILYARWDYVDRHNMPYMSLWSTLPDGSGTQAVFGNYTRNPHCVFEARSIPGSTKLIFTASGHHANTGGSLVLLDTRQGVDGDAPMTRLTPEVAFPETEGWPKSYFANPFPLSEQHYLVAWSDREMIGWPGPPEPVNALGIYLFDTYGNLELIYRDPEISSVTPMPLSARERPFQVASVTKRDDSAVASMLVLDVYQGLESIPRGTIRNLRLVGVPAKTHPTMNYPVLGVTRDDPGKFVLGTVPVAEDGSAFFRVPAGVTMFVQALDEDGMAVQTMRSAFYAQPGQAQTCIGCHEQRTTAPPIRRPAAIGAEPADISPGPPGSWPLNYQQLVQPVLDQHCVSCHSVEGEASDCDLTAESSYDTLVSFGKPSLAEHVMARYLEGSSQPGACSSRVNSLWQLLDQGHYGVKLENEDRERIITWMDTYGQRLGSFDPAQEQQLLQLRRKLTDMLK